MIKRAFIDCGLNGAIAITIDSGIHHVYKMPTNKDKTELDHQTIKGILEGCELIVVEEQFIPDAPRDRNGKIIKQQGMSTNMMNYGIILGIGYGITPNTEILPSKKWKAYHGLLNSKNRSKYLPKITKDSGTQLANKKYGLELPKSYDGIADSLLIAEYKMYKINGHRGALEHNMLTYRRGLKCF